MRIVFDSSIGVSALEYGGVPRTAIEFAASHDEVLFCQQIENEIVETLTQKFAKSAEKTQQRIKLLAEDATWVVVPGLLFGVCRDPNDDFILECAIWARRRPSSPATKISCRSAITKASASLRLGNTLISVSFLSVPTINLLYSPTPRYNPPQRSPP